jgi:hypothetical protein
MPTVRKIPETQDNVGGLQWVQYPRKKEPIKKGHVMNRVSLSLMGKCVDTHARTIKQTAIKAMA